MDYIEVTHLARSRFMDQHLKVEELRYYYTSNDGYACELKGQIATKREDQDAQKSQTKYIVASDLHDGDTILIAALRDNICPRQRLDVIAADNMYNASIQAKVKDLEAQYDGWRGIRGDGNCFYRAVIFGLLEQLVQTGNRPAFDELRRKFEEADTHHFSYEDRRDHQEMLMKLRDAASSHTWITLSELKSDILTKHPSSDQSSIDLALIRACRAVVSSFLKRHQDRDINDSGLAIKDAILPSHIDCQTIEDYCRKYVDVMGEDAQGAFVDMGLLQSSLHCSGVTVMLDARAGVPLNFFKTSPFEIAIDPDAAVGVAPDSCAGPASLKSSQSIATIHLLLRPGHYDLLYPKHHA
jgi:ubiquitin thioesterase protein OTUB1